MKKNIILLLLATCAFITGIQATPTKITVRVKSKDAKFIGTGIGGAYVTITNTINGEILAQGLTTGASGNTTLLLETPLRRYQRLTDDKTARFEASIDIKDPLFVEVQVTAPVSRKNAAVRGSVQCWLIPGKDINGDGLIIELPGFVLDIIKPTTFQQVKQTDLVKNTLEFKASLTMLCGCTITKGGTWDADSIEVAAYIKKEGVLVKNVPLQITDQSNIFAGSFTAEEKGNYQITVYAYDPRTGNTGVDKINFVIQ